MPRPAPASSTWTNGLAAIALFLVAAAWPLIAFHDPAMQDYSNHLARAFILIHPDQFTHGYVVRWAPIPDLAWDVWALGLSRWMSLHAAAVLFYLAYFALALGGLFALNQAIHAEPLLPFGAKRLEGEVPVAGSRASEGRRGSEKSLAPLLAAPFLMNGGYTKGFFNFDLGLALVLWALAAWLWLGEERWRLRLAVGTAFSTLLYFVHFYTFAVYGLFLLGLEVPPRLRQGWKGVGLLARDGLQALPAFGFLFLAGHHAAPLPTGYGRPWQRLIDLTLLIDTNHVWLNIVLVVAMLGAVLFAIARGWLTFPSRLAVPLILCALIFAAIPDTILGTAYVAWRSALAAVVIGIAALAPAKGSAPLRPLLALALGVVLLNSALFAANAARSAKEEDAFLRAIAPMHQGARLFWAHAGGTQHALLAQEAGAYHMGSEAVMARHAVVQSMFTYQGQQVLGFRDALLSVPDNTQTFLPLIEQDFARRGQSFAAYIARFDYVLLEGPGDPKSEAGLPRARLTPVNAAGDFRLYAVKPAPTSPHVANGPPDE